MNLSNITVVPLDNIAVYNYMSSHEEDSLEIFYVAMAVRWNRILEVSHYKFNLLTMVYKIVLMGIFDVTVVILYVSPLIFLCPSYSLA